MSSRELLAIRQTAGDRLDVYSGVARLSGSVFAAAVHPDGVSRTAALVIHPTSNFLGHYALEPLAARGVTAVGLTTRYVGNDSTLIMENCVLDVAAAVRHLRASGFEKVVLVGNSGGGGLAALYQSQAEAPSITATPAGDPPNLMVADLPPVDAIVMLMAHPGRASTLTTWLDPAIRSEAAPDDRDDDLDLFSPSRTFPLDEDFLERYRAAQEDRNRRITTWVKETLATLDDDGDLSFLVQGTAADPRFLDLSIEPSDRAPGTLWGDARIANTLPAGLARYSSLRSWLSQWSLDDSNCDALKNLPEVSVPVLVVYGSADNAAFPSDAHEMFAAARHEGSAIVEVAGADHYFLGRPDLLDEACTAIVRWLDDRGILT
ncbi:alpha/beta fold hydrolase [Oryzobacter telluris]|uniref:alpha/beta fold hydrolase n=1 Tax=Oryzobacter telluris TaxID=3149179 RepID=UPI00370D4CB6